MDSKRLSLLLAFAFLVPLHAWAQRTPLYQAGSTYRVDERDYDARVLGTGTPVEFERPHPQTGKNEKVCGVLTPSHVTGGDPKSLKVHLEGGAPVEIADRCNDPDHDLELVTFKDCKGFKPLATFNPTTGYFEVTASKLDNWYFDRASGLSSDVVIFPDVVFWMSRFVNFVSKSGRAISIGQRGGNTWKQAAVPQVLVPGWAEYEPSDAINEGGDPKHYDQAYSDAIEDYLPTTAYGQEVATLGAISPGMSGAPAVADITPEQSIMLWLRRLVNWDFNYARKGILLGISTRVMRSGARSYLAGPETMRQLVERNQKNACGGPLQTEWKYRASGDGEGLTYRVSKTPWGEVTEVAVATARAGSANSLPTGSGGSRDVGSGGSRDVGETQRKEVTIDYQASNRPKTNAADAYLKLGVKPGLGFTFPDRTSKDVLAIRIKSKSITGPQIDRVVFADSSALDFMKKNGDALEYEFLSDTEFFDRFFAEHAARGMCRIATGFSTKTLPSGISLRSQGANESSLILVSREGISVTLKINDDTLKFRLDSKGRLIGGKTPYFTPEIQVVGTPSGKSYSVDLMQFLFLDLTQIYAGTAHPAVKLPKKSSTPLEALADARVKSVISTFLPGQARSTPVTFLPFQEAHPSVCALAAPAEGCEVDPSSKPFVLKDIESALK